MMFLPVSLASTEQSSDDCAVSMEMQFTRRIGEFGEELIFRRTIRHHGRVAETKMDGGFALHAFERAIQRLQSELPRFVRNSLHVRLVDLHDVGAGGEQILDLFVDGGRVIHRHLFFGLVEIVMGLLRHGVRARNGDFDAAVRIGAQKLDVANFDGVLAADLRNDARHVVQLARARHHLRGIIEIDSFERGGEAIGVALAANFAVRDDVEAGAFLSANRENRGIVLRLFEKFGRDTPKIGGADARRQAVRKLGAIDQPIGLGIGSHQRCRKQSEYS